MPGKVNPTQPEAITMAMAQVFGNDVVINIGVMTGSYNLRMFNPVMCFNLFSCIVKN
jgi:fumarate hydratase class II